MNMKKIQLLSMFLVLVLLTACGKQPVDNSQDALTSPQESTISTQGTDETVLPSNAVSIGVGERDDSYETTPESNNETAQDEEPKKGLFETIVETVAGWFGGGNSADSEQNATNSLTPSETIKPTESATQDNTQQTDSTEKETDSTEPSGDIDQETTEENKSGLTYEQWLGMSEDEQEVYTDSFATLKDFVNWFNAAKAEYDDKKEVEEMDGTIDLTP